MVHFTYQKMPQSKPQLLLIDHVVFRYYATLIFSLAFFFLRLFGVREFDLDGVIPRAVDDANAAVFSGFYYVREIVLASEDNFSF